MYKEQRLREMREAKFKANIIATARHHVKARQSQKELDV